MFRFVQRWRTLKTFADRLDDVALLEQRDRQLEDYLGTLADADTALNALFPVSATNGGTGQTSFTVGDLLYASTTTTLSKLGAGAVGNVLISGTAPSWNKATLGTHTAGNYAATLAGTANQISSTGATSGAGTAHTLSIPFATMTAYSPSLTATTTNPTNYGPNAQYGRLGDWCFMLFSLDPTGSFTAGTGNYRLSIPVTASDAKYGFLIGAAYNSSNADPYLVNGWLDSSDSLARFQLGCGANPDDTTVNNPNYGLLSNGFPFAIATGDWIRGVAVWKV